MFRMIFTCLAAVALWLGAGAGPAHAYLDPGAGSLVLQGLIGALAGGAVMARTFWSRIVMFFGGGGDAESAAGDDGEEANAPQ